MGGARSGNFSWRRLSRNGLSWEQQHQGNLTLLRLSAAAPWPSRMMPISLTQMTRVSNFRIPLGESTATKRHT
jgi:hypothetical protein